MKIYVEGNYKRDHVTAINAHGDAGNVWITKRQYQSAAHRLGLADGDFLRLAPVGDNDPGSVMVDNDGRDYAIIN